VTGEQIDPQLLRATVGGGGGAKMYASVYNSVAGILQHEGARGLYKGVGAMALGAGPAHAVRTCPPGNPGLRPVWFISLACCGGLRVSSYRDSRLLRVIGDVGMQVYFAAYEKSKRAIMDWSGFAAGSTRYANLHPAAAGVSGALATVVRASCLYPLPSHVSPVTCSAHSAHLLTRRRRAFRHGR